MAAPKIVLIPTFLLHPDAEALLLESADIDVVYGLDEAERAMGLAGVDRYAIREKAVTAALDRYLPVAHALHAMGPLGHLPVTAGMLDQAANLEVVFISAAGTDRIDVPAATEARGPGHQRRGCQCAGGGGAGRGPDAGAVPPDRRHRPLRPRPQTG